MVRPVLESPPGFGPPIASSPRSQVTIMRTLLRRIPPRLLETSGGLDDSVAAAYAIHLHGVAWRVGVDSANSHAWSDV